MSLDPTRSRLFYLLKVFGPGPGVGRRQRSGYGFTGSLARLAVLGLLAIVLAWWWTGHQTLARSAGTVFGLERLTVEVPLGRTVEIGRAALMHPRGSDFAELRHIAIDHRATARGSAVFMRNVADQRRLWLRFGDDASASGGFAERYPLPRARQGRCWADRKSVV